MNGARIFGEGPNPVLAIHGWFGHAGAWGPLVDSIDPERFTYAFIDIRGYGRNKGARGTWTVDEIAHDALSVADALGWSHFAVLGHSMGGMFAQRVATLAPERVSRVACVNGVPASGYPFDEAGWDFFSSAATQPEARRAILDLTTGKRLSPFFIRQLLESSLENSTEEAFAGCLQAWGRTNFAEEAARIRAPLHVILGEHDPAVPASLIEATTRATCPHATVEVLANAGHYPMFEVPVALATSLERFLG